MGKLGRNEYGSDLWFGFCRNGERSSNRKGLSTIQRERERERERGRSVCEGVWTEVGEVFREERESERHAKIQTRELKDYYSEGHVWMVQCNSSIL